MRRSAPLGLGAIGLAGRAAGGVFARVPDPASDDADADPGIAALLPAVVHSLTQLAEAGGRGEFTAGAIEYSGGTAVLAVLHSDALLVVLAQPTINVGPLLFDLRRHRAAIAGLLSIMAQAIINIFSNMPNTNCTT